MIEDNTHGTVVEFVGSVEFEDGETIVLTPSRPSKIEAIQIGWKFYEADEETQTAMLNDLGPVLVRRSLRVFGNYAARTGQRDVAEYAAMLRDEIKVVREERVS
jgi:hypothetical protein